MQKKVWIGLTAVCIIVVSFVIMISTNKPVINQLSLIEDAVSEKYHEKKQVEIFNAEEIYDYEIRGFSINGDENKLGFAVLKKDANSSYELIEISYYEELINRALDINVKNVDLLNADDELIPFLVVLSSNPDLAKITMKIDDEKLIEKEVTSTISMTLFQYPKDTSHSEYLFYDQSGNLIE